MDDRALRNEIKQLIIRELHLEGRSGQDLDDSVPLFGSGENGQGLGLDSLDALQLATALEERFGVKVPEGDEARVVFASVDAMVEFVARALR